MRVTKYAGTTVPFKTTKPGDVVEAHGGQIYFVYSASSQGSTPSGLINVETGHYVSVNQETPVHQLDAELTIKGTRS